MRKVIVKDVEEFKVKLMIEDDRDRTFLDLGEAQAELLIKFLDPKVEVIRTKDCHHKHLDVIPHRFSDWYLINCEDCRLTFEISQKILLAAANLYLESKDSKSE